MTNFDVALLGRTCWLELADGERIELQVDRWRAEPDPGDEMMLAHCAGPALDIGCGPGRLAAALTDRGISVLGVDTSPVAIRMTRSRGAMALRRNVFERLPGEGHWRSVLLADGNIGIGGDPVRMLRRVRQLLTSGGNALVEIEPPGEGVRNRAVRLNGKGNWFPWAWLGADAVDEVAHAARMRARWLAPADGRWFTELVPA